jgi:hypothetical protein
VNLTVPPAVALDDRPLGEAALAWASAGWSVFPIVPRGKTPYKEGEFCGRTDDHTCGFHCAVTDNDRIAAWWSEHPDSNIGLSSSTAFIVDEDRLGAVADAGVTLPRCPYATTGRAGGGRHFFLRAPDGWDGLAGDAVKVTPKVPAVEVKGFGKGYVVAAPSIHASGARYHVETSGYIPEAPKAVIAALVDVEQVMSHRPFVTIGAGGYEVPGQVAEGGRYMEILKYVAHLYNRHLTVEEMWLLVRDGLAPVFVPRLTERELRDRFKRATADMHKNLGAPRGSISVPETAVPLELEDAPLTEYDSRPVEWVWPGWLPRGVVTIMDGNPGVSKSTLVADLVARLTTGTSWPDEEPIGSARRAMWITTEDDPGRVLRPRIEAAGGDPSMVLFVKSEVVFPAASTAFRELLVRRANEPLGLGLVILDPLFSHIEAKVRTIADAEMRRGVMNPLTEAAEAADLAILVVRHFSKDTQASAINRGAGSLGGIVGAARAQWSVTTDPDDESGTTKAIGVSKLNYARTPAALRYEVVDRLPPGWITGSVSGISWLGPASVSIETILRETESSIDAQQALAELLANGPVGSGLLFKQMQARGFGRRATRSAKTRLGVGVSKTSMTGGWTWSMPSSEESRSSTGDSEESEEYEESQGESSGTLRVIDLSRARAGVGPLRDSSDSSKSAKSHVTGASRVRGRAREEPAIVVEPTPESTWAGPCQWYDDHREKHRWTPDGWTCDACHPPEDAS